ncbi:MULTISPECIES: hypothetical protein [Pseudoxanthomonas]|uniref:hypothetical protein n=1 Tax=Pseudoxanthomonas TaxID=83618 RepID=UPI00161A7E99|nr:MULTISPECIES: hypothetical protein [Pseudoxanthomonas]MBB3277684.1 hypothetical protein [Pseudoxanthomonas sp. OG2]MBV7474356.1 hypothetical protein [Pseudoxanthomonas sp. PXM05]
MRPRAAWLAVLASVCLLLSTLHFGAMAGQRPHGFGHWDNRASPVGMLQQAPEDGAPDAGRHDDQPAKKRRVTLQPVSQHAEPEPVATPRELLPVLAFSLSRQPPSGGACLRTSGRVPSKPAPPCQRHRGQAPPVLASLLQIA